MLIKEIGAGLQSQVYLAQKAKSMAQEEEANSRFAAKVFTKEEFKDHCKREYEVLQRSSKSEYVIKVLEYKAGAIVTEGFLPGLQKSDVWLNCEPVEKFDYILVEYCPFGDMFDLIKRQGKLKTPLSKAMFI